jgi:hypothetical protein
VKGGKVHHFFTGPREASKKRKNGRREKEERKRKKAKGKYFPMQ